MMARDPKMIELSRTCLMNLEKTNQNVAKLIMKIDMNVLKDRTRNAATGPMRFQILPQIGKLENFVENSRFHK